MSVSFSTPESIALEKQIEHAEELVQTNPNELDYVYEIDNCVQWIRSNKFEKVCLQFPDHLLADASEVGLRLQERLQQTVYILGDTAYESCCVDYIGAAHVDADAVVHFGPVCFSKPSESIPTLLVFEKSTLDLNKLCDRIEPDSVIVLDTPYATHFDLVLKAFDNVSVITDKFSPPNAVTVVITSNQRKILNFKLAHRSWCKDVLQYDPTTDTLSNYDSDPKVLKRRRFLIEKIKDAETFGIIIGTVAVRNYRTVIDRIKRLLRLRRKKYYVISVGKPTVAKLANFPEIDVYVVIACGMNEIYDSRDYYKPIVAPHDVETALNPRQADPAAFCYDFNNYSLDSDITNDDVAELDNDVSLISGKVRVVPKETVVDSVGSAIAVRSDGAVALQSNFGAGFLSQRNWKGLEQNLGVDKPDVVSEGRRGIAQGYKNENK